jgi:hypothetical protein
MRKLFVFLIAILVCASVSEAYVYRSIGKTNSRGRMPVGAAIMSFAEESSLGPASILWHPNTIDSREATSARPFTPGVLEVKVKKKVFGNLSIPEGVTILVMAVYPDNTYELFGTSDIEGITPSNVLAFDYSPSVMAYTNVNAPAKGDVHTRVQYIAFVKYAGQSRTFGTIVNVR